MNITNRITSLIVITITICCALTVNAAGNTQDEIKIYNVSGEIAVAPGKSAAAVIAVDIPDDLYIYANPKGKGIGKATEVIFEKNEFLKSWEVRYPEGEIYQAKGDPDSVNIYRKTVRFPVAFTVKNNASTGVYKIKADLSILMCSSEACIPVDGKIEIIIKVKKSLINTTPVMMNQMGEFLSLGKGVTKDFSVSKIEESGKNLITFSGITAGIATGIPESILFTPDYPAGEITGILKAILFGLIAGFLLNFMPCVLPVVSLKIMSFVMNAGERKRVILTQGFLFSAGIIVSFLILAALAAFSGHKWGTLFQNRIFIICMAAFIFAMALSLFGVFTLNVPMFAGKVVSKRRGIYLDAFIKGAVATLLATPCSGPFLGGTLAWTLTRPPETIFVIFLSVGVGMALPYILLALNPSLIRLLPKPGVWMKHFEIIMGFLLMFTVVYLIGILSDSARMGLILFLLFISIGLWQFGVYGFHSSKRGFSFAVLLLLIAVGYIISFKYLFVEKVYPHERTAFNTERILKNRDLGIITVVEFTAEWCPNCSLVEKLALDKDEVTTLFARDNVEFMVADITSNNTQAESLVSRLGSKSIPLLAVFPPGDGFSSPICLRDIYSANAVIEAVKKAENYIIKK